MMKNNLFIIAREGWSYVAYSALLLLLLLFLDCDILSFIAFLAMAFFLFIFRNPERELLNFEENSIVSPVDGRVNSIEELSDSEYAYKIEIESSYLDVSLLRTPINATLESICFKNGTRVASTSRLFKSTNENVQLLLVDNNANRIKIEHILAQSVAPLSVDVIKSQHLSKSSRYGLMLCGVTYIYLPHNVRINVNIANEVKASQTLIANFS